MKSSTTLLSGETGDIFIHHEDQNDTFYFVHKSLKKGKWLSVDDLINIIFTGSPHGNLSTLEIAKYSEEIISKIGEE